MKFVTEYRNLEKAKALAKKITATAKDTPMTFMEVCGTHTMSIARFGIYQMLPPSIRLISGPGCPVCVTPNNYLDHAIALARQPNMIICTFGDMMRVPGSSSSLDLEHARGADVRVVYSTLDAIELAQKNPDREIVFLGVGFETTAPTIAASIDIADANKIKNYSVLTANKVIPPALLALLSGPRGLNGFLLPGHVSSIIGVNAYQNIFKNGNIAGVIAGFEPTDILESILDLATQIVSGKPHLQNSYARAVSPEGNLKAQAILRKIFEPCNAAWRGIGVIPESGLKIRGTYATYDAAKRFDVKIEPTVEPKGCRCGEILTGVASPENCPLFGKSCTPDHPVGACMVSSEGTCAAYYRYGGGQ